MLVQIAPVAPDLDVAYRLIDFTDPWTQAETLVLLHGNSESGRAWYAWIPILARHFRLVIPDLRGFGQSSPMPEDHQWSLDEMVDDLVALTSRLGVSRFHLVGAKVGGTIALHVAATKAALVSTLTVLGPPIAGRDLAPSTALLDEIRQHGLEPWARRTMPARLGEDSPPAMLEWWTQLMAETAVSTQLGFLRSLPAFDVSGDLPHVACPTLVITSNATNNIGSPAIVRAWQEQIPRSEMQVLDTEAYHVAAAIPDEAAHAVLSFINRVR